MKSVGTELSIVYRRPHRDGRAHGPCIPDTHDAGVGRGDDHAPIGAEVRAVDRIAMQHWVADKLAFSGFPESGRAVARSGHNAQAVAAKLGIMNSLGMRQSIAQLPALHVPDLGGVIGRGADEARSIFAESYASDYFRVRISQNEQGIAGSHIGHPD